MTSIEPPPVAAGTARDRRIPIIALGLALLILLLVRGLMLPGFLPRDPGAFCYEGYLVAHGRIPYRDFWEHKNPGMALLLGAVFSVLPPSPVTARLAELLLLAGAATALVTIERRTVGVNAPGVAAPIFALLVSIPQLTDGGLYTGFWSGSFHVLAVAAAWRAFDAARGKSWLFAITAGGAFFASFACRQTGLAALALLFPLWAQCGWKRGVPVALTIGGTFVALAATGIGWLWTAGAWTHYVSDTIHFNVTKNAWLAGVDPEHARIQKMMLDWVPTLWLPAVLAISGLAVGFIRRETRLAAATVGAWLALGLAASVVSRAGYWHYGLEMLAPLALAASLALARIPITRLRRPLRLVLPVVTIASLALSIRWDDYALGYFRYGIDWFRGHVAADGNENLLHAAATRLSELAEEDEVVHIWSALPTIHFLSHTLPATRYPQNLPLLEASVTTADDLAAVLRDVQRAHPRYCVVVTEGMTEFASRGDALPPAHQAWIESHYAPLGEPMTAPDGALGRYNGVQIRFYQRIGDKRTP